MDRLRDRWTSIPLSIPFHSIPFHFDRCCQFIPFHSIPFHSIPRLYIIRKAGLWLVLAELSFGIRRWWWRCLRICPESFSGCHKNLRRAHLVGAGPVYLASSVGFGFTVLPWSSWAYWATTVDVEIMNRIPLLDDFARFPQREVPRLNEMTGRFFVITSAGAGY